MRAAQAHDQGRVITACGVYTVCTLDQRMSLVLGGMEQAAVSCYCATQTRMQLKV